jgi:hypothetical protein
MSKSQLKRLSDLYDQGLKIEENFLGILYGTGPIPKAMYDVNIDIYNDMFNIWFKEARDTILLSKITKQKASSFVSASPHNTIENPETILEELVCKLDGHILVLKELIDSLKKNLDIKRMGGESLKWQKVEDNEYLLLLNNYELKIKKYKDNRLSTGWVILDHLLKDEDSRAGGICIDFGDLRSIKEDTLRSSIKNLNTRITSVTNGSLTSFINYSKPEKTIKFNFK